ncbi:alpha/beta hydrolase family protein [Sandaracinus amylolyticus]|uniref:Putative hydrolase n=1 Tax=Sandaracinus amylolyticus TaxID=927083 RepID=A0A0F6W0A8_9BACT|nr:alpha/beta hydrolase family protein [Sandaracinus amylolyticus]AKF04187.1 putative hydrolase [Sandaracinus amylolyticus]
MGALALALALALAACGGDEVAALPDASVAMSDSGVMEDASVTSEAIAWASCTLQDAPGVTAECARVRVPLDWSAPEGEHIELFVERVVAAEPSGRAMWVLMGGPGQSGQDFEGLAAAIAARDPGLDIYFPDHRGTGDSTRLVCTNEEAPFSPGGAHIVPEEWPACRDAMLARWGAERLAHFSTTSAAHDVQHLIDLEHDEGDQVVVLGISYGTYLANRYLQIAPDQADGVVLDSMCAPDDCFLSEQDLWEDEAGRAILARCTEHEACRAHLGDDPVAALATLHERVAAGHCPMLGDPAVDVELLRTALGQMMFGYGTRQLVPALIHRMARCDDADRTVIQHLYQLFFGPIFASGASFQPGTMGAPPIGGGGGGGPRKYSFPLAVNIVAGEMWEPSDPSREELQSRWEGTLMCRGVSRSIGWEIDGWPRYSDALAGQYGETSIPVFGMNADLDTATPARYARAWGDRLEGAHQRYVEIPNAAHSVIAQGVLTDDHTTTCGRELLLQFVRDPEAELDTSCLAQTLPLRFHGSDPFVEAHFGTTNLWGDP